MAHKLLILYASIGSGHYQAAHAIADAINRKSTAVNVSLVDLFPGGEGKGWLQNVFSTFSSMIFPNLYTAIWNRGALSWLYHAAVILSPNSKRIVRVLDQQKPQIVICTHTFPCSVVANWKVKKNSDVLLAAIATDFAFHNYWPSSNVDLYFSPTQSASLDLMSRGISSEKIFTFGIPVSYQETWRSNTSNRQKKVMIIFGSRANASYKNLFSYLKNLLIQIKNAENANVVWSLVFGTNERWKDLAELNLGKRQDVQIFGYVNNIAEVIGDADIVVTKPGGLTLAEILAYGKPVILMGYGSGQEFSNSKFLIRNQCGLAITNPKGLFASILQLVNDQERLSKLTQNSLTIGKPNAADDVASIVLKRL